MLTELQQAAERGRPEPTGSDRGRAEAGAMPVTRGLRLSARTVRRLSVAEREAIFWDRDLPGFGVRVYPTGVASSSN